LLPAACCLLPASFIVLAYAYALGQGIAVDAQVGRGTNQVSVEPPDDFGDKAPLKLLPGFQKQYPLIDHFQAKVFQFFLQSGLLFGRGVTHTEVLFWFQS
jgi:hypothetical protein